ncbi:hypothetical protein WJX73_003393 [Symbiochloris irregularis]|uniref:Serine/threonine-protein phosphatase 5 n=1 Tax=Symbiochloris irregularis TaxID=706552 RepID=A0AAW1PIY0_9CHLO
MGASTENGGSSASANSKLAEADQLKQEANTAFKEKHWAKAVAGYTRALEANPDSAILYANRAAAHIRLENFGSAIEDGTKAVELDPNYIKGYFRRADANFAFGKAHLALADFRRAAKASPRDPDLRKKLAACEKEVKRLKFEEALAAPEAEYVPAWQQVDLASMTIEDNYKGPSMEGSATDGYTLTLEFIMAMIESFRKQQKIHRRFAFQIVMEAQSALQALPTLVDIPIEDDAHFTVCGDIHGQFYDLLNIFEMNGFPSESNPYLFNGDFVDRGSFSVEVILTLFAFKLLYPDSLHLARGNHESKSMNLIYGFDGEVKAKYTDTMVDLFRETFCWLPLAHVLNKRVFVVHGGLFARDGVKLEDLRKVDRFREPPEEGLMCEALWSDPQPSDGRAPSKRGIGVAFGPDVTRDFLTTNSLDLVVRSHEVKDEGYAIDHNGYCITVFSAPNYVDQMGNKGAFIRFTGKDMTPQFTTYDAVPHPEIRPMAYANPFLGSMLGM